MNRLTKLILLLLFLGVRLFGNEVFDKANELYENGEFYKAAELYQSIVDSGYESHVLFYNLANSYYKSDRLANAVYYYEKAIMLNPSDEDINYNLELVRSKLVDKVDIVPEFFVRRWIMGLRNTLNVQLWAIIGITLFSFAIVCLIVYLFSTSYSIRRTFFVSGIISLIFSLFIVFIASKQYEEIYSSDFAIIFEPSVTAWSSPRAETQLFVIHEGLKVKVIRDENEMVEIKLPDGNKGWIKKDYLKML